MLTGMCVCVYSNSRNDVPRVAQLYGTILPFMRVLRSYVHILRLYAVIYIFYFLRNANSHRIAAITLTQSSAMTLCAALFG